jgi:hypothetical protein
MADSEQVSPANLLDQLADLDPQELREVATIVRGLSETVAEVPDGKTTSPVLGVWPVISRATRHAPGRQPEFAVDSVDVAHAGQGLIGLVDTE